MSLFQILSMFNRNLMTGITLVNIQVKNVFLFWTVLYSSLFDALNFYITLLYKFND